MAYKAFGMLVYCGSAVARTLTVSMIEHAEDLRDYIATAQYGEVAAAAAAESAKQKLQKNAAPKL